MSQKRALQILTPLALGLIVLLGFQNCSPEHMVGGSTGSNSATGIDPAVFQALETAATTVLNNRCVSCHNGGVSSNLPNLADIAQLKSSPYLIKGKPQNSPVYLTMIDATMPPGQNLNNSAPGDVIAVRDWIQAIQ